MLSPDHTVLALDLGTTLGWAVAQGGVITRWGVEHFPAPSAEHNAGGRRLAKFWDWLANFREVTEIFYERAGANFRSGGANEAHHEMKGIVKMFCYLNNNIPLMEMHQATLKSRFAGSGHASKEQMCATAHQLGWKGGLAGTAQDHDAADACALIICKLLERDVQVRFA